MAALIAVALGVMSLTKTVPYLWAALVYGFTVVLVSSWVRRSARKRWLAETGNSAARGR